MADNTKDECDSMFASSEASFFLEAEEVHLLIENLSIISTEVSGDRALARLRVVFDKYLECPTLLDPNLETPSLLN